MSKLMRWTIGLVGPLCLMMTTVQAGEYEASPADSSLKTYRDVDGQTYFALSLRPTTEEPGPQQRDMLVLVDTSASQTGLFRADSLDAVTTIAHGLRADERLNIMAIDLQAVPMTDGFAKPSSVQLEHGLAKLRSRTPLGATDLVTGIRQAVAEFEDTSSARTIVYIGDGMSRANALALDELEPLVQDLVQDLSASHTHPQCRGDGREEQCQSR